MWTGAFEPLKDPGKLLPRYSGTDKSDNFHGHYENVLTRNIPINILTDHVIGDPERRVHKGPTVSGTVDLLSYLFGDSPHLDLRVLPQNGFFPVGVSSAIVNKNYVKTNKP